MTQAEFKFRRGNPDVLTSIANLSNDEVFTPPEFANQMLDTLQDAWASSNNGANIWEDSSVTFLDPFTKSGVFLREITERLTHGLAKEIPDLQGRVNHILTKQVFGIGITHLTALLARRSVYCSKWANGEHSIATAFDDKDGNIWFERTEHTWVGGRDRIIVMGEDGVGESTTSDGKCKYCGANKSAYSRDKSLETHAYALIHTVDATRLIENIFGAKMKFDVVIGNPPYQLNDGGGEGSSASPLYHRFVQQAMALDPRFLTMVIPARWYSGGKGLDEFRDTMLRQTPISEIHDFPETSMVFPGVNIRGGVCYFLAEEGYEGPVKVVNYRANGEVDIESRALLEHGITTFVRYNKAISILNKVRRFAEPVMSEKVQSRNPYGIASNFAGFSSTKTGENSVLLYRSRRGLSFDKEVFIKPSQIPTSLDFVDKIKVLVSKASPGGDEYPHLVLATPFVGLQNSVSTETYLIVDFVETEIEGRNLVSYMQTRFFRFLVSLIKNTQNISKGSFSFVPVQNLSNPWTDDLLFEKYGITEDEIEFIKSLIRPMGEEVE